MFWDMKMLKRVTSVLESFAPLTLAETSWDNVGLLIESIVVRPAANKVVLTIDLTASVLKSCIQDPAVGMIISYHPPLFRPLKRLVMSDEKGSIAIQCLAAGISVYSPHTALDNCPNGINDWLASGLGSGQTTVIQPNPLMAGSGAGRIHTLKEPMALSELVQRIKQFLKLDHVRLAAGPHSMTDKVQTIAICAGSGSSVLKNVTADVYWTGEMSHHDVLSAHYQGSSVILCEHTNTERGFLKVLQERLSQQLPDVEFIQSKEDTDPLTVV